MKSVIIKITLLVAVILHNNAQTIQSVSAGRSEINDVETFLRQKREDMDIPGCKKEGGDCNINHNGVQRNGCCLKFRCDRSDFTQGGKGSCKRSETEAFVLGDACTANNECQSENCISDAKDCMGRKFCALKGKVCEPEDCMSDYGEPCTKSEDCCSNPGERKGSGTCDISVFIAGQNPGDKPLVDHKGKNTCTTGRGAPVANSEKLKKKRKHKHHKNKKDKKHS